MNVCIERLQTLRTAGCCDRSKAVKFSHNKGKEVDIMSYVTGQTIKELRERKKMTQKELAEQISVSDKTVSKWETGVSQS